jgi:hypothetical protein
LVLDYAIQVLDRTNREISALLDSANVKTVFVIDEAAAWFGSTDQHVIDFLEKVLKKDCLARAVFIGTGEVGELKLKGITPKELENVQWWFWGPSLNAASVEGFISKVLKRSDLSSETQEMLLHTLFRTCGNHVGMLSAVLREILSCKSEEEVMLIPHEAFQCRMLGGGKVGWVAEAVSLARELMACGSRPLTF